MKVAGIRQGGGEEGGEEGGEGGGEGAVTGEEGLVAVVSTALDPLVFRKWVGQVRDGWRRRALDGGREGGSEEPREGGRERFRKDGVRAEWEDLRNSGWTESFHEMFDYLRGLPLHLQKGSIAPFPSIFLPPSLRPSFPLLAVTARQRRQERAESKGWGRKGG
jgi:hypothetical protein